MAGRVLVVDDDESNRALMRLALEDAGYVVEEGENGERALERLRMSAEHAEPLVALVDLRMPGLDGTRLLATVAAEEPLATRHAYIVVTASVDATAPEIAALRTRLHAPLLAKPFDVDLLLETVATATARLHEP